MNTWKKQYVIWTSPKLFLCNAYYQDIFDKGLMSRVYKQLNNKEKKKQFLKWAQDVIQTFVK